MTLAIPISLSTFEKYHRDESNEKDSGEGMWM